jgi:23S rRNA (cytosine1962-C5)-methyltransferase
LTATQSNLPALSHLPEPSARRIAVRITPEAERALREGHPWLFDRSIRDQSHEGQAGDLAIVFDRKRRFLAAGLYDPHSPIRVRILQHTKPAIIDRDWFYTRLALSAQRRAPLRELPLERMTTGYRLVHGENDGLPGLVIDRYDRTFVIKLYTSAWIPHLRDVTAAMCSLVSPEGLVLRLGRALSENPKSLYGLSDGMILLHSPVDTPWMFRENGLNFEVDPIHGQKTGFFLDQRDNRAYVEELARGTAILNLFAYTGGFSVYAARGGARSIIDVDTSRPALETAVRNMAYNRDIPAVAKVSHRTLAQDAFDVLRSAATEGRRFNMVIVDPPAFAQNRTQISQALTAYARLTRMSLTILAPNGTFVQASCSSWVDDETFFETIHRAASQAGRPLREIDRTGHPLDHPVSFKEGAYLKCLFAQAP